MGKWAVIYSSVTGNTKKIAEAMAEAVGADCDVFRVQEAPEDVSDYDVVLLGYWLRLGAPDPLMLKYLPKVHGTRVCFFQTHGTDPTSEHAVTSFARAAISSAQTARSSARSAAAARSSRRCSRSGRTPGRTIRTAARRAGSAGGSRRRIPMPPTRRRPRNS